jgi:hypothetical protein
MSSERQEEFFPLVEPLRTPGALGTVNGYVGKRTDQNTT